MTVSVSDDAFVEAAEAGTGVALVVVSAGAWVVTAVFWDLGGSAGGWGPYFFNNG